MIPTFCKWIHSYSVRRKAVAQAAASHCSSLICTDFFCRLEKGRTLEALCIKNKDDNMGIFKQVSSINLWSALSHLCLLPRVLNAIPKT